jgi:hypothetical protein
MVLSQVKHLVKMAMIFSKNDQWFLVKLSI